MPDIVSDWLLPWPVPSRRSVVPGLLVALTVAGAIGPVLNPETQIITGFESLWHQPLEIPKRFSIAPRLAIVLDASGSFSPSWNNPDASNQIRGWFNEFRDPVWPKKGLKPYVQVSGPFSPPWNLPAASNQIRGWFNEFRDPVWPKRGLRGHLHPTFFAPPRLIPPPVVGVIVSATESPVTDTLSAEIWVYDTPPAGLDQTGLNVSIIEVVDGDSASASLLESADLTSSPFIVISDYLVQDDSQFILEDDSIQVVVGDNS